MNKSLKENVTRGSIWLRLVYMIVFAIAYSVAEFITVAVVAFQFLASLFTGRPNDRLVRFGRNLARYYQQIILFLTFETEEKPFPFGAWPDEPHEAAGPEEGPGRPDETPESGPKKSENESKEAAETKKRAKRRSAKKADEGETGATPDEKN